MAKEIRAKFSKGMIEPLEELDLEEGEEIVISIIKERDADFANLPWKRELEKAAKEAGITTEEQIIEMIHESRRENN